MRRLLSAMVLALAACKPAEPAPSAQERHDQAAIAREIELTRRAGAGLIRLQGDACLQLAHVRTPWAFLRTPEPTESPRINNGTIVQSGVAAGLRPYERTGFDESFQDVPHDGRLRVHVDGSMPGDPWREPDRQIPSPKLLDHDVRVGILRRFQPWSGTPLGLIGYADAARHFYADPAQRIRCTDEVLSEADRGSGWLSEGICRMRSTRAPYFNITFSFDARDLARLPAALARIETVIEATRGPCPIGVADTREGT